MHRYRSRASITLTQPTEAVEEHCLGRWGLTPTDKVLEPTREPPVGAHIVTPRSVYTHHGIYVGEGRVIQYGGLSRGLCRGRVEEVSLSQFARGRKIWVRSEGSSSFDREEVIHRARLRLGENGYHPLKNNCEHFCEWCVRGEPRSYQVDELTARYLRAWQGLLEPLNRALIKAISRWWDICF
jgi:lecithin:retinol acyltransferase